MTDQYTSQIIQRVLSRRGFLAGASVATAATLSGCGGGNSTVNIPTPSTPAATAVTDVDVINFALNLEYLEAEFYLRAATGQGVPTADGGAGPANVNWNFGGAVPFSMPFSRQIANEFAQQELQHIRTLRAALTAAGATPISSPALDYVTGFNGISALAGTTGFNPVANDFNYFIGALSFEDVGVTAYTGTAALLTNTQNLNVAAGIQAAEAYHSASMRTLLVANAGPGMANATAATTAIANYNKVIGVRAALGGSNETVLTTGITTTTAANGTTTTTVGPSTVVQANASNSVGYARTTDLVLHIVYGATGAGLSKGGFFPNGLNGNIKTTAS